MFSRLRTRPSALAAGILLLWACAGESLLSSGLEPPATLTATPLNLSTIRLDWSVPASGDLQLFRIERRANLSGPFRALIDVTPTTTTYFDSDLQPATFYGYRVVTVDRVGERSIPSVVAGALTPPLPGIRISTSLSGTPDNLADPNGYLLRVSGPKDTSVSIGSVDARTLSPLPIGTYTLTIEDVASTCTIGSGASRTVIVSDTGLNTQPPAAFDASCVDPARGTIVAVVAVIGDSVDVDGYRLNYAGIITGDTAPAVGGVTVAGTGENRSFANLRPGDYQVSLSDVEPPCQVSGPASRNAQVVPLSLDTLLFAVSCPNKGGGNPNAPFVLRNVWAPQQGANGSTVTLDVSLDLAAVAGQDVGSVQADLQYNAAMLSFVSASAPAPALMNNLTVNTSTAGTIGWLNFTTGSTPPTGVVPVARFTFTVNGGNGQTTATRTAIQVIGNFDGSQTLETQFRVVEDTFTVGTGGGGGNQSPTAQAGGPYSGAVGANISFSSTGSGDPDGTITSYSWSFGDGTASTQANPQKAYASAGTFTATLTVTDNLGGTASDQATVTISGGGGNQSPTAEAGGPYSAAVGANISFTSAGSSDPDGSLASYSWSFGDGTSSTQANPSKSYASAGTYTATLTVTDNQGATASDQATVTVVAGGTPITWTSAFGVFNPGLATYPLVIALNLTQDIAQTSGPEALQSYAVDSVVWDPNILEYHSLVYSSGGGSVNPTNATGGCKCKLSFTGVGLTPNTGVVPIATINFKPKGVSGSSTTPRFFLASVLSTPQLGSFNYLGVLQQVAGSITLP